MFISDERHAFIIGFSETLCPWKPRFPMLMERGHCLDQEYHYYLAGRALGFITLLLILLGTTKLVKEVLS